MSPLAAVIVVCVSLVLHTAVYLLVVLLNAELRKESRDE